MTQMCLSKSKLCQDVVWRAEERDRGPADPEALEDGNMRLSKKLTAWILAAALAVAGLPYTPAALAIDPAQAGDGASAQQMNTGRAAVLSVEEDDLPQTQMRFVQTEFDSSTGILTMSLQVKPTVGAYVGEGFFMFQVDGSNIHPITNPRSGDPERIDRFNNQIGVVGTYSNLTSASVPNMKAFLESSSSYVVGGTSSNFNDLMGGGNTGLNFDQSRTGYLVSPLRRASGSTKMLDCYLQFYFATSTFTATDPDTGYATILDLKFQCYSGYDESGRPKPAENTDFLFANSFKIPANQSDVNAIGAQFTHNGVAMTMGGAGWVERNRPLLQGVNVKAFYYYDRPVNNTEWRRYGGTRVLWWDDSSDANPGEAAADARPGMYYDNIDVKYTLLGLTAEFDNSYEGDDPDFVVPSDEVIEYPRYSVPTYAEEQSSGVGVPFAYLRRNAQNEQVAQTLKYVVGTRVSENSISSPESEDFAAFTEALEWEFGLDETFSLNDEALEAEEEPGDLGEIFQNSNYFNSYEDFLYVRAKEAVITAVPSGADESLIGKKLWNVYGTNDPEDDSDDFLLGRAPVGVLLDVAESQYGYLDQYVGDEESGFTTEAKTAAGPAGQLHVTNEAADPDSFIWSLFVTGEVYLRPSYAGFRASWLAVRLYKGARAVTYTGLSDDLPTEQGNRYFWVGTQDLAGEMAEAPLDDAISNETLQVGAVLLDQYYIPFTDRFSEMTLVPAAETQAAMDAAGKGELPFTSEAIDGEPGWYTIIYSAGMNANEVTPGMYDLVASYDRDGRGDIITGSVPVEIKKPEARLSFITAQVTAQGVGSPNETGRESATDQGAVGTVIRATVRIPTLPNQDATSASASATITPLELANQWRPENTDNRAGYDIIPGKLRDQDGILSYDLIRRASADLTLDVSHTLTYPVGMEERGVSTVDINTGKFSFTNETPDGTTLTVRLTAKYQDDTVFVEYVFTFARVQSELLRIDMSPGGNETEYHVTVPLPRQADTTLTLIPTARDQYNSTWNWSDVERAYAPGTSLNTTGETFAPWRIYVENNALDGNALISQENASGDTSNHMSVIRVKAKAETMEFKVYARYGKMESAHITVKVERETSKPTAFGTITYARNGSSQAAVEYTSPNRNENDLKIRPLSVPVYDQYETQMDLSKAEAVAWSVRVTPASASDYVDINDQTGEITVKKLAPNLTIAVTCRVENGGERLANSSTTLTVKRADPIPQNVTPVQDSVELPTVHNVETATTQLTATGETQYGDGQTFTTGQLEWTLDSVTYADGTVINRLTDPSDRNSARTGAITEASGSTPAQVTTSGRNTVVLTNRGRLSFRLDNATSADSLPTSITVAAITNNQKVGTKVIAVTRQNSAPDEISVSVYPETARTNGMKIPSASDPQPSAQLSGTIKDQYGITMAGLLPTWSLMGTRDSTTNPGQPGIVVGASNDSVTVTHEAKDGDFATLRATYAGLKSVDLTITAVNDPSNPIAVDHLNFLGIQSLDGQVDQSPDNGDNKVTITLPTLVGEGYRDYVLYEEAIDQYTHNMFQNVTWSIVGATIGDKTLDPSVEADKAEIDALASMTSSSSGNIRFQYNEAARDAKTAGKTVSVTVRAVAESNAAKTVDGVIVLDLENPVVTYAVARLDRDRATDANGNLTHAIADEVDPDQPDRPVVPKKRAPANKAYIVGVAQDQYGRDIDGKVNLVLLTTMQGSPVPLSFTQDSQSDTNNKGTLSINSNVTSLVVNLRAEAVDAAGVYRSESNLRVDLSRGTAYVSSLELYETNADHAEIEIPLWQQNANAHGYGDDPTDSHFLRAEVRNQYDGWMQAQANSNNTRPVWAFAEDPETGKTADHTGVEFPEMMDLTVRSADSQKGTSLSPSDPDGDGKVIVETIEFEVSNRAVPEEDNEKYVSFHVTTNGYTGDDFEKTQTIRLYRDPERRPSYLYLNGDDGAGAEKQALMRPTVDEESATYTLQPQVFDQYGVLLTDYSLAEGNVTADLVTDSLSNDVAADEILNDAGDVTGYEIYYEVWPEPVPTDPDEEEDEETGDGEEEEPQPERTLIGSFERATGTFTMYTEWAPKVMGSQVRLQVHFPGLDDANGEPTSSSVKEIVLNLAEDALRPKRAEFVYSGGDYVVTQENVSAGDVLPPDYVELLVYDQYDQRYEGNLTVDWSLFLPERDANGELTQAYDSELDAEGNPRSASQFLVQLGDKDSSGNISVLVHAGSYYENKQLVLHCVFYHPSDFADRSVWVSYDLDLSVRLQRRSRPTTQTTVTAAFDAGQYGAVVGSASYEIEIGTNLSEAPGVKTLTGYGFLGWTEDGESLLDVTVKPLFADVTYVAVYKEIVSTKFIEGYRDGTVRPSVTVTRAEFTTMVVRALGGYDASRNYGPSFEDVDSERWYANYIAYAKRHGIVGGYPDGSFRPEKTITRAEAARVLASAAGLRQRSADSFSDVGEEDWFSACVTALKEAGVVNGYGDGSYRPRKTISRAETAKIVVSLTDSALDDAQRQNIIDNAYCPFSDLTKDDWAYAYILRAAGVA